ncbi:MAG: hypothetical protein VKO21_05710 [Candidatus Sericytochromatia bacterium]|nr:hypothetical protein [Candidatus Sericytochromatia bacterium]
MEPLATIVLDVPDQRPLPRLLDAIYEQSVRDVDILVLSPEPRHDRLTWGREAPIRNLHVAPWLGVAERHNVAARMAKGPLLVTLSCVVSLWERDWLRSLLAPFRDNRVVAVGGCDFDPSKLSVRHPIQALSLKDMARWPEYGLHRSNAAFRRDALLSRPFPRHVIHHPERVWAMDRLLEGHKILMAYRARLDMGPDVPPELELKHWSHKVREVREALRTLPKPATRGAKGRSSWWSLDVAPWLDAIVLREQFRQAREPWTSPSERKPLERVTG